MIHIPIEERYQKGRQMFHSGAFAIAAGVIGVGAAATTGIMSAQAADRAAKAADRSSRQYQRKQRQIEGMVNEVDTEITAPKYEAGQFTEDAKQMTAANIAGLEGFLPGARKQRIAARDQLSDAMNVINSYLAGDVPQDVKDQIMRGLAERGGAGFAPQVAGQGAAFQVPQGQYARNLGLTSLQLQQTGLSAIPSIQNVAQNWQQLSRQFITSPLETGQLRLGYGQAAMEAQRATAGLDFERARILSGQAQGVLAAQDYANQASYAAQMQIPQAIGGTANAVAGGLQGYGQAMQGQQLAQLYGNPTFGGGNLRGELQYATGTVPKALPV